MLRGFADFLKIVSNIESNPIMLGPHDAIFLKTGKPRQNLEFRRPEKNED